MISFFVFLAKADTFFTTNIKIKNNSKSYSYFPLKFISKQYEKKKFKV